MKIIGLTGGIATGKSTVTEMIRKEGFPVIDADVLAREVVAEGSFGLRAVFDAFGPQSVEGGRVNRSFLREKIFQDQNCRKVLENITHPLIQWRAGQEFNVLRSTGHKLVFYDAALIFEKNLRSRFDAVAVVYAKPEVQIQRLLARDKITREQAEKILASQMPMEQKVAAADFVIDNSGSFDETRARVTELAAKLAI